MTKSEELLALADALAEYDAEAAHRGVSFEPTPKITAALREYAATLGQEPVAWRWSESGEKRWFPWTTEWDLEKRAQELGCPIQYAYAHPPKAEPAPKACRGIPRVGCNYLAECETVCNKCGNLHAVHFIPKAEPAPELPMDALELAILFHHTYERLAPNVGYDTRVETRIFDPESPNGKLMVAVCAEILPLLKAEQALEPVAWIQPDHLQKARVAPFLCRVEPTKRMSDFIPIYTEQVTHGLQMECPASATDDSGSADGVGARCVDAAVMEHAARPLKAEPAPEPLTDAQVYEIWERAAQIDLSGRVNELIRTKDAQCVIRAILKAQKEKT